MTFKELKDYISNTDEAIPDDAEIRIVFPIPFRRDDARGLTRIRYDHNKNTITLVALSD